MKKRFSKLTGILTLALLVTAIPYTMKAATPPKYKTERTSLYENTDLAGVYTYTLNNVKKGNKVKWVVSGPGKKYATLKYKETVVKGRTSSNKITIATNKEAGAKNASIALTAKVYSAKGSLLATVKDSAKIKVVTTDLTMDTTKIVEDLTSLRVGAAYDFDANVLPMNTTSKVYWAVTNLTGKDYSKEITSDGIWTPSEDGKYTVKAMAKNSATGKTYAYHTASVTVGLSITSVKQIAANKFSAIFNADASKTIKSDNIVIATTNGTASIPVKSVEFSADGKLAYITTAAVFKDKTSYTVSYGGNARAFIASVGAVKRIEILTETVEAGKETQIEYALYDENNMDVKAADMGIVSIIGTITNGYCTGDNKVYMYTVGKTGELTLSYKKDDISTAVMVKKTIRCVEATATEAATTNFTITPMKEVPDYDATSYVPTTSIAVGETGYLHFRALDKNKQEIKYSSVQYASLDDNSLIVDRDGRITPIKKGNIRVNVLTKEGEKETTHTFSINILDKRVPTSLNLSRSSVEMSNIYVPEYKEYINITATDQYGTPIALTNEACTIKEIYNRQMLATYDSVNDQISISSLGGMTGTYTYQISMVVNGVILMSAFDLNIKAVPSTGTLEYNVALDHPTLDMKVDGNFSGNKTAIARVQKYIGGAFIGYANCLGATIEKNGLYYSNDLTEEGSKTVKAVAVTNGTSVVLNPIKLVTNVSGVGECKKAELGTYTITLQYQDSMLLTKSVSANITLTDSQAGGDVTLRSNVSSKTVANALALVNDCVTLSDGSTIYNCSVTGTSLTGEAVTVMPGQQIHIDTISVKRLIEVFGGRKVYMYYTINLDKTLTNKS